MALDPSIFLQGAQLQQQNAAKRDAAIGSFFDKLTQQRQIKAQEAKAAETDYEGAAYRVIRDSQAGRAPNPKDVELAKAWDVMNTSQNAVDPSTGMPFPKNRSIFDSLNQGAPFVPPAQGETDPMIGQQVTLKNTGENVTLGKVVPPPMGMASPELMQGLAEADAANVPSEVPNVFGNLASTLPQAANPKQELEKYGAELDIAKESAKAANKANIELGAKRMEAAPKAAASFSEYTAQDKNLRETLDQAIKQTGAISSGYLGQKTKDIGGTPAADLGALLETIQADAAFATLQKMRDNSPTGGALGAVSEKELGLLQSAAAALNQAQSPSQLRDQLKKYKKLREGSLMRVKNAYKAQYGEFPSNEPMPVQQDQSGAVDYSEYFK